MIPRTFNLQKIAAGLILVAAVIFFILFFIIKNLGGDIDDVCWRFALTKVHLMTQWQMPYFTPGRCGGFHLAADAQDFIFSAYMLMSFIIPNVTWAIKITTLLLSVVFFGGMFMWLRILGVNNSSARLYGALITVSSGYWVYHMTQAGNLWAHGLVYAPWIMVAIERIFQKSLDNNKRQLNILCLIGLLFLLINSGYYWLQTAVPMITARVMVEIFDWRKPVGVRFKEVMTVGLCTLGAIILSLPRLAAIYEFQLKKFPRLGGEVSHLQVVGDNPAWLRAWLGSLFDGSIITQAKHSLGMLGYFWDYTNFIGIVAAFFIGIGIVLIRKDNLNKALIALLIAALFQLILTRTTHMGDFIRMICPLYKQITWHWRGSAIVIIALAALMARGFQWVMTQRREWIMRGAIVLLAAHLLQIGYVYTYHMKLSVSPAINTLMVNDHPVTKPLTNHYAPALMGYLFGYGNEHPPQLSYAHQLPIMTEIKPGFLNMHDIRLLASQRADHGYYLTHQWPLWSVKDKALLERFVNFEQIIEPPMYVQRLIQLSIAAWIVYGASIIMVLFYRRKNKRNAAII